MNATTVGSGTLSVEWVSKSFGTVTALDGVSLEVEGGAVFGLLGPNGAGKTTLVKVLTTLLRPDAGRASVAGFDVVRDARRLRQNIGLAGQYAAVDENLLPGVGGGGSTISDCCGEGSASFGEIRGVL